MFVFIATSKSSFLCVFDLGKRILVRDDTTMYGTTGESCTHLIKSKNQWCGNRCRIAIRIFTLSLLQKCPAAVDCNFVTLCLTNPGSLELAFLLENERSGSFTFGHLRSYFCDVCRVDSEADLTHLAFWIPLRRADCCCRLDRRWEHVRYDAVAH